MSDQQTPALYDDSIARSILIQIYAGKSLEEAVNKQEGLNVEDVFLDARQQSIY